MHEASAPTPRRTPRFTAIIAHGELAEFLRRCIAHHLSIGVDSIFVLSVNVDDAESAAVPAEFKAANIRAARLETFASDGHPLDYFTAALDAATRWAAPDWVLFLDSDEFWIPAGGSIRNIAGLDQTDVYSVRRFNVPPLRGRDGTVLDFDVRDPSKTLVVGGRHAMDAEYLAQHPDTSWIAAKIGPKIMVRPELVESIAIGAHDFVPRVSEVRASIPADLLIAHVPFTTLSRFRRKVEAIRPMLTRHADHFPGSLAWHWRRWLTIADAGGVEDEFAAQLVDEANVPKLIASGMLTTPARLFAEDRVRWA